MPNFGKKEYVGDGVYASFDGYHIWLDTSASACQNQIALEPEVFQSLLRWMEKQGLSAHFGVPKT